MIGWAKLGLSDAVFKRLISYFLVTGQLLTGVLFCAQIVFMKLNVSKFLLLILLVTGLNTVAGAQSDSPTVADAVSARIEHR